MAAVSGGTPTSTLTDGTADNLVVGLIGLGRLMALLPQHGVCAGLPHRFGMAALS